ncbi:unnamed protein product [Camellia sinensis]
MVPRVPDEAGLKPWQQEVAGGEYFNYSWRGLWLRAVVLGGNDGIVAAAFLVMGVGTFMHDMKPLIIAGLVRIVAGALSTAVAEFASVSTQFIAAAFLVMGVGTFMHDMKPLIIAGIVRIVAGALSTAVAEFASVSTQVDTVKAQEDRDTRMGREGLAERVVVPSPTQVAVAASLAYMIKNFLLKFNVLDELKMK